MPENTDKSKTEQKPSSRPSSTPCSESCDLNFVWTLLRDAERGLNRKGLYANIDPGGVCYEVQLIHQRMKSGDFLKARTIIKEAIRKSLPNAPAQERDSVY